jgi:hypothetical protein
MLGVSDYGTFVVTILVFLLIPGPGNLALVLSTSKGGVRGRLRAAGFRPWVIWRTGSTPAASAGGSRSPASAQ